MIVVTGATGKLGRLVIEDLLNRGVPAGEIVAAVRDPERARSLAGRGVQVRHADYGDLTTLAPAFGDAEKLLLISSSEVGQRLMQHQNAVDAASAARVGLIVYTSILNADTSTIMLAADHQASEGLIRNAGLPFVFLRNGWYLENYTETLRPALQHGAILGSTDGGRVAAAARADFAAAAAAVLAGDGHRNAVYELGGDQPFTMAELAAEVSRQSGNQVGYQNLPPEEYVRALVAGGMPEPYAVAVADSDQGIARGELTTTRDDLRRLIGRPTTTLADAVAAVVTA